MSYPYEEVEAAIVGLREAFVEAERRNTWSWIAEKFYHEDAVYICPFGDFRYTEARGRLQISQTHFGRDMEVGSGWAGWSFPILDYAINGDNIISHWVNRAPGRRPDGSHYEQHGVSFITYGGGGKFSYQYDLFDIGHMMHLCDELEDAGLLSPKLKEEWVVPMKRLIIASLNRHLPPG
ncbi:MAG TPA: nuclear transport factor 2 family protein [Alphaproteobacteria bacterium]|nr:nuclear transport factor 2 family protein [Alphaproteobacteria bacterium]